MAPPRKPKDELRTHVVQVLLTKEEHQTITKAARKAKKSASAYVQQQLFVLDKNNPAEMAALATAISNLGHRSTTAIDPSTLQHR